MITGLQRSPALESVGLVKCQPQHLVKGWPNCVILGKSLILSQLHLLKKETKHSLILLQYAIKCLVWVWHTVGHDHGMEAKSLPTLLPTEVSLARLVGQNHQLSPDSFYSASSPQADQSQTRDSPYSLPFVHSQQTFTKPRRCRPCRRWRRPGSCPQGAHPAVGREIADSNIAKRTTARGSARTEAWAEGPLT